MPKPSEAEVEAARWWLDGDRPQLPSAPALEVFAELYWKADERDDVLEGFLREVLRETESDDA